jgi:hypothetical protein
VIIFLDGVDGAGKSTLINRLHDTLSNTGIECMLAPPLWTFLRPIDAPEEFAPWVHETAGHEIAQHLLTAMSRRIDKLATDIAHGIIGTNATVLVDRGPKTVTCSARAHAATGARANPHRAAPLGRTLDASTRRVRIRVSALGHAAKLAAIELRYEQPQHMIDRLSQVEEITPSYQQYLHVLHHELGTAGSSSGSPTLHLPATSDLDTNVAAALAWSQGRTACP